MVQIFSSDKLKELVLEVALEHKPIKPVLINLKGINTISEWLFIASADNPRQGKAIGEKIVQKAKQAGYIILGTEGLNGCGNWVLVDLGDIVVHIFSPKTRELYDLEGLWGDENNMSFYFA